LSRYSACITVPEDTRVEGKIGKMTMPGGMYAVGRQNDPNEHPENKHIVDICVPVKPL